MTSCDYCDEFASGILERGEREIARVLSTKEDIIIFPTVEQIVEGYLLLSPREHVLNCAALPLPRIEALEQAQRKVREVLTATYGPPVFFEHGPTAENPCGSCVDHAHLHAVPTTVDLTGKLYAAFPGKEIASLAELSAMYQLHSRPYLFFENQQGMKHLFVVDQNLPAQYVRQMIAALDENASPNWNWRLQPTLDVVEKAYSRLAPHFRAKNICTIVCQQWLESERGWGIRPDGCSLHKNLADRDAFVRQYWDGMPDEVPDEYSRPDGEPYSMKISQELCGRIKGNGLRLYDSPSKLKV